MGWATWRELRQSSYPMGEEPMPVSHQEEARTEVAGAFNPFVITPEWLDEMGFGQEGVEAMVRPGSLTEGTAFTYGGFDLSVSFSSLSVSAPTSDCGDFVARIIGHLPHTPMRLV